MISSINTMDIFERKVTKAELAEIYKDFDAMMLADGIEPSAQERYEFVAEDEGKLVGIASGLTNHRWFYLSDLWVERGYRGRGIGGRLLSSLEDKVKSLGIGNIYTWTAGHEAPAFYKKRGYEVFTVFENFYERDGYDQVGFAKNLGSPP